MTDKYFQKEATDGFSQNMGCGGSFTASKLSEYPVRCPKCGYSYDDARLHMDHHLCPSDSAMRVVWEKAQYKARQGADKRGKP